jgi:polyhydroxyalkanoate synthesis regulator protein
MKDDKSISFVKYRNRRLYSHDLKRYVTLEEIGDYWDRNWEVSVYLHKSLVDITVPTMLEIVRERVWAGQLRITREQLRELGAKV